MIPRAVVSLTLLLSFVAGCTAEDPGGAASANGLASASGFLPGAIAADAREEMAEPISGLEPLSAAASMTAQGPPPEIRGLYVTAYSAGSPTRMPELLALASATEINTFVVDVKTEQGVHYPTEVTLGRELQRRGHVPIADLAQLVETLHENGIYSIARIVAFKDPLLVEARPDWSIKRADGRLWLDREGNRWVSPWDDRVWDLNLAIAEEAARAGFQEIQFDYVRFPEAYPSLPAQHHPRAAGDRTEAIASFLTEARRRLDPLGVVVSADVFGMSMNDAGDVGIGQQWERIASIVDHILPMAYPSHYMSTHLPGIARPNRMPYETITTALGMAVIRNDRMREAGLPTARVITWLQAFDAPWVDRDFSYGVEQLRAQIRGVYDVGLEDWILWDPGVRYERLAGAFEPETLSRAQPYDRPASLTGRMDRYEGWGMRNSRELAARRLSARAEAP